MNFDSLTVKEINDYLKTVGLNLTTDEREQLSKDPRSGVQKIYKALCRKEALEVQEKFRIEKMKIYEKEVFEQGYCYIAGIDEAGRGPLAGPVVAAAVIFPPEIYIPGIDDSKKLSPARRNKLYDEIKAKATCWSVGMADVREIDEFNIFQATLLAMRRAVAGLKVQPEYLLIDAVKISGISIPQLSIVKGDRKSISIAAASIIAKVTRDRLMGKLDREYPNYGFSNHKGYGTEEHIQAIKKYGTCPIHRKSFTKKLTDKLLIC